MAGSGSAHLRDGALLSATSLIKTFKAKGGRRVHALSDVSLDIVRGETLGVVGESGSGKSTLARAILALPKPDSGRVRFDGKSILDAGAADLRTLRQGMQMVFQDPLSSLNPAHSIFDIVEMPLLVAGRGPAAERRRIVGETLHSVGLDVELVGKRRPYELSGGQCQRVSIARALVLQPGLLICDEPVSALDVSVQAQVLNLLEDAKAAFSLTVLFISHDLGVVKGVSDRVMVMYLGKLCEVAPTDSLYATPRHPYTATLLASVPSLVPGRRTARAAVVRGETPSPLDVPSGCRFRTRCPAATDRCAREEPQIRAIGAAGHYVACHHPITTPSGSGQDAGLA
jgi:peptide/nickel transport system ATP-binding protein